MQPDELTTDELRQTVERLRQEAAELQWRLHDAVAAYRRTREKVRKHVEELRRKSERPGRGRPGLPEPRTAGAWGERAVTDSTPWEAARPQQPPDFRLCALWEQAASECDLLVGQLEEAIALSRRLRQSCHQGETEFDLVLSKIEWAVARLELLARAAREQKGQPGGLV